jgi:hypothetical protein
MNTISEFIDRLWQFLGGFADSMNDSDYAIYYVIRDKFFALVLQGITEGFSFLFGEFLNSIYRILFSNPSGTVSTGKYAIGRLFSYNVSGDVFSVDMIYFFFGLVLTIFIFKFIFDLFLKIMGMLR